MKINRQEIFKSAGYLGAALLLAGYLRYTVQELMDTINKAMMIAGGVLLAISLALNFRAIHDQFRRRSTRLGANTAVMTVAVVAILALINFLGYRHHKRFDVTAEKLYTPSDQTRKIVSGLQKEVKIIKFEKEDDANLRDRMQEYRDLSRRLSYERIDPEAKPEIAKRYKDKIASLSMGDVVVESGSRVERVQETSEQALTNAILKVTREQLKAICFTEGHSEKPLSSTSEAEGLGLIEKLLKDENYQTRSVNLVTANQVPSDCDVLVAAGPKSLFPQEAAMIGKYLDAGGKALLMVDPDTAPELGDVLKLWGIELANDTVIDASGVGRLFGTGPAVPLVINYGSHPVTKDSTRDMTFFPLARSLNVSRNPPGGVSTTELLKTSEQSFGETELKDNEARFDEGKDKKGPVTLGVAASKSVGEKEARLLVIGDSDFATNNYARHAPNRNLFMNMVNWLAQDEDLIGIRPKNPADRRVTMTVSQQNLFRLMAIFFLPLAVIGAGGYIWWKRR
jgi:ABC-type uncharacterized transport system involved in gliding motility auxiliary subunit